MKYVRDDERGRRRSRRRLLVVFVLLFVIGWTAGRASAATWEVPCSANVDVATCERLDAVFDEVEAQRQSTGWLVGGVLFLAIVPVFYGTFRR